MKVRLIGVFFVLVLLFLVTWIIVLGPSAAGSSEPSPSGSPSASPSPSPMPTIVPASGYVVHRALHSQRRAVLARAAYCRALSCFGRHTHLRVAPRPKRSATAAVWLQHQRQWQRQARWFTVELGELIDHMKRPGGSSNGVRWLPLARWIGWPSSTWSMLTLVIMRESSGRERAGEENGGIFRGLMQVWRSHVATRSWNLLYTAEYNLRVGLRLWRESGWGPWVQTAY